MLDETLLIDHYVSKRVQSMQDEAESAALVRQVLRTNPPLGEDNHSGAVQHFSRDGHHDGVATGRGFTKRLQAWIYELARVTDHFWES